MKHIKAKFKLTSPAAEEFCSYGWESLWTKKTQMLHGEPVEIGSVVHFAPITVMPDGKCLILATEKNIKKIRVLVTKGQMLLGPGETLEVAKNTLAVVETEEWPSEPVVEGDEPEVVEAYVVATPAPKVSRKPKDMTPDLEA